MNGATVSMFVIGAVIALVIALVVGAEIVTQTQALVAEGSTTTSVTCPTGPTAVDGTTTISSTLTGTVMPRGSGSTASTTITVKAAVLPGSADVLYAYATQPLCTYDTAIIATGSTQIQTAAEAAVVALAVIATVIIDAGLLSDTDGTMSLARTVVQFIPVLYFIGLFAIPAAIGFAAYKRFTA